VPDVNQIDSDRSLPNMARRTVGIVSRRPALPALLLLLSGCCGWFAQPTAAQLGRGVPS